MSTKDRLPNAPDLDAFWISGTFCFWRPSLTALVRTAVESSSILPNAKALLLTRFVPGQRGQ